MGAASILGALWLSALTSHARADAAVVLASEPDAVATCRTLALELEDLGIDASLVVLASLDPNDIASTEDRLALVLCRTAPLRIEIFRGASPDALLGAPDHVALASPTHPEAAAVEASEWIRALSIALPDAPPEPERVAPPTDTAAIVVEETPRHPTFALSLPYLYAGRTLRSFGVAASVAYPVGAHLALAARITAEMQPSRTIRADDPFRVRNDRFELGVEHVCGFGRLTLRSGVVLGATRIAVRGLSAPDRRPDTSAHMVGMGALRVALVYRVATHVAVGLEADAGVLFREVDVAQMVGTEGIRRFVGSVGLRVEVTP